MIYKPSSLYPNLNEIDILSGDGNTFSAQANTLGSSVKAYSVNVLSEDGATDILISNSQNLGVEIQNKEQISLTGVVENNLSGENSVITFKEKSKKPTTLTAHTEEGQYFQNGKNYQWNIRMYENHSPRLETELPTTQICSGFTVGSTTSVIWVDLSGLSTEEEKQKVKDQLKYDKWVEISLENKDDLMMPLTLPNKNGLDYPTTWPYKERRQINWVYTDLGWNKDIVKLELVDKFTYNYKNGKPFTLYNVSDEHTDTSFYVEPNDDIELGNYISIGDGDATTAKKIIGYGQLTGEIRLQEALSAIPENGQTYKLWEKNLSDNTFTEKKYSSTVERIVGGKAITDSSFKIMTSYWNSETDHQIFVQPNINIKTDALNPPQIVWENGVRLNIKQVISNLGQYVAGKKSDITFNKLDNTQWVLKNNCTIDLRSSGNVEDIIVPQSNYQVYTDFMDSLPNAIIYARSTPTIIVKYKDYREADDDNVEYNNIDSAVPAPWRDISFVGQWESPDNVESKYYHYYLYLVDNYNNEILISESGDIYDFLFKWEFKGVDSNNFYKVRLMICDKYGKEFQSDFIFYVEYKTYISTIPLSTSIICEEQAVKLESVGSVYVTSVDKGDEKTVTSDDVKLSNDSEYYYLDTTNNKILNYKQITDIKNTPIQFPQVFSFFTKFRFPYVNESSLDKVGFFNQITGNEMKTLMEIAHSNYTEFYLQEVDEVLYDELYSTLYTRQANQYLVEAINTHPNGILLVLYTDSTTPLKDSSGNIIYFTLKEYNTSSSKIIIAEKFNTSVMNFDHYVYYDKNGKQEIGSSVSLAEAGLDRREIYLSIFIDESTSDNRKKVIYYNKQTGEITLTEDLILNSYNNLNYKAYTLKSENNFIPLPSGTDGNITLGGDLYTVKVGRLDNFTIDTENKIIRKNSNALKMKIFKNNSTTPLFCFDNGKSDSYDLQNLLADSGIGVSNKIGFALQYKYYTNKDGTPIVNGFGEKQIKYELVDEFKEESFYMNPDVIYILTKDIIFGPVWKGPTTYYIGEYKYVVNEDGNGDWILQVDTEYMYLDEGGDYKDEDGKTIDVVIDQSLIEDSQNIDNQTYTTISTNVNDTSLRSALTTTSENKVFITDEYNDALAQLVQQKANVYIGLIISADMQTTWNDTSTGDIKKFQIKSYTNSVLTLKDPIDYTGKIYGYKAYYKFGTGYILEKTNIQQNITNKGLTPKTSSPIYLSVFKNSILIIDKKKILSYSIDNKLTIEGGVSLKLSNSELNTLTYTAYNYINNIYSEIEKTGDGKIVAGTPIGGTSTGGKTNYRWGPKTNSGKEESDFIWMPNTYAARQTNLNLISQKWFDFSLLVDNSKDSNPVLSTVVLADD